MRGRTQWVAGLVLLLAVFTWPHGVATAQDAGRGNVVVAQAGAAPPAGTGRDGWQLTLAPMYLWASSLDTTLTVGRLSRSTDISFGDVLENFDFGFTAHVEDTKGAWTALADILYLEAGKGETVRGVRVDVDIQQLILEVGGTYRLGTVPVGGTGRLAFAYGPYGSAGAWASYNPATGTYARGGYASGPYGSAGWAQAYNPYTGARAAGGQVTTPYGSRGGYAAYNPYTGAYSHGGYASGSRGTAAWQSGYNPATGASAGRGSVQSGDQWARGGYASTAQGGTVAGAQTSKGGAAVGGQTASGQTGGVARTASGDVYAGKDGTVYKRSTDGAWQKNTGSGWQGTQPPQHVNQEAATRQRSGQMSGSYGGGARRGGGGRR